MTPPPLPRVPYDEARSPTIREAIRTGDFADEERRRFVNCLVFAEWYSERRPGCASPSLVRPGLSTHNWRIAAVYPEAFAAVRRDLDRPTPASTRVQYGGRGDPDPDRRREWAHAHREQWHAVRTDDTGTVDDRVAPDSPGALSEFPSFRFPRIPYHRVRSETVRDAIQAGDFDDLEHRRRVNQLVYLERWARDDYTLPHTGTVQTPLKGWFVAAHNSDAFDLVRAEFDEPTRAEIDPDPSGPFETRDVDPRERERRAHQQWRAVQG